MGNLEAVPDPADGLYDWVAAKQHELEPDHDQAAAAAATEPGYDVHAANAETEPIAELLAERMPTVAKAFGVLARTARYANHVPSSDREALLGGTAAVVDAATLEILEGLIGTDPEAQSEAVVEVDASAQAGLMSRLGRAVQARRDRATVGRGDRERAARIESEVADLRVLMRLYPGDPERALAALRKGRGDVDAAVKAAALSEAFQADPDGTLASLAASRDLAPDQERRLAQGEIGGELSRLRGDMARRREDGLGLDADDTARYQRYERQRAARALDESGAVAELDFRAERTAALAEAVERNRPDGKVLLVTDENARTPGLVGPLLALFGTAEVHTAGVPYHQLTRDHLEGVTGAIFPEQKPYNDINQRYAIILLQGAFPPIKPEELLLQIGEREGDMSIIPGDVDQSFVDGLMEQLSDEQSEHYGVFSLEMRPSSQVSVYLGLEREPLIRVRREFERPTFMLVRSSTTTDAGAKLAA